MSGSGVDFLENWISDNIPRQKGDQAMAGKLAAKLIADGVAAGFTLADMELEEADAEKYIREAIVHLDTPGTPSD
jgi:hypothetical protein